MSKKYPKVFIQRFKESGQLKQFNQVLDVKILKKTKKFPTKLSLEVRKSEISPKAKAFRPVSFRTDSKLIIEDIISSLTQVLAYFKCNNGSFNDPFGEGIDKNGLESRVNNELKHLFDKIRVDFMEGIRRFESENK